MSAPVVGIIGFLVMFLLIGLGMPIAFSMSVVGLAGIWYLANLSSALATLGMQPFAWAADQAFMCIPLFILMGHYANSAGLISAAYQVAYKWVGRLPGGLAISSTLASAAFGAVSGSSTAAAATMSTICIPEMEKRNYKPSLMTSSVAVGGTLAILIPPSMGMILYGIITEESIGKLFIAGIIPGIIMTILLCGVIIVMCKINPELGPAGDKSTLKEKVLASGKMWEVFVMFFVVLGGMYLGVFTPTEAAAVGALLAIVFAAMKRTINFKSLSEASKVTARTTVMIFLLLIGAMIFNTFITFTGLPQYAEEMIQNFSVNRYVVLIAVLLTYFFFGCVMDAVAMAVLLLPIFHRIIVGGLGFDGIWFGVVIIIMAEIGLVTPPIGMNCFVVHGMFPQYKLEKIFLGVLPFVIVQIILVALFIAYPEIVLFLPNMMK